ncbi:unnamed protein product [Acanthosepion pharaonis]|uniref:Uncharacterized protein n=1 Tax=Acanthosepion pharaonis TaxID=158019 RepID=A0A812BI96_ACAPH|nr:unnamed protein product [Sepia pharaonis]
MAALVHTWTFKTFLHETLESRGPNKAEFQVQGHHSKDKLFHLKQNGRLFGKKQRKKTISRIKRNSISDKKVPDIEKISGVMDRLWSALNYGSLTELHNTKIVTSPPPPPAEVNYWAVIKEKVHNGVLFVEIGGCLTASNVATDWSSDSVVISLLFKDLYNECISNARDLGLRNFLIGSVSHVQQMVESLSSDKTVAIEHLHLSNIQLLWQSLLPHECEDLLAKLLALSWRVYIVNPTNKLHHFSPYTRLWNLQCTIDLLHGTNSWESPTVYQVTLKSGYRPSININTHILNKRKQMKPSANFLIQGKGDGLVSQGRSKDDPVTDYKVKIKSNFKELPKMEEIKETQENNNGYKKEEMKETDKRIYQSYWDAVKLLFEQKSNGNFSLLIYGTKHLTLLTAKTGLLYPHSTILNIVPKLDAHFADMYRNILPPNVLTAINDLDTQIINTISHLPNLLTFQILGIEIFAKILWLNEGFIVYLGKILSLAQVTVFLVPKPEQFLLAQIILGNINGTKEQNQDFSFKNLILKAAATFGGELNIEVIKDDDLSELLIFVELKYLKKEVIVDCSPGKGILILESLSSATAYIQTTNSVIFIDTRTIMLSFLLAFKLQAADKRQLFLCYIQLTIYKDMCPHLIFWSSQGLSHSHQQTETAQQFLSDSSLNLLSRIFMEQLMESSAPFSFLEYQSEGYQCFLNLAITLSRKRFNFMIGQLLSVSVSTFLILPSEKNEYLSTNHPSTFYKNAERKIIFESAWADVQAEVEVITSQHFEVRKGNFFPWRLLRANIKNLTKQVNHHFESYLDGHTRTYMQHCMAIGSTHYKVHLQRQSDGLTIPYGNVRAITLIALLRMGLLAEIQKKLYHQFLKLPLYEDMAPWNIAKMDGLSFLNNFISLCKVFSAGQLMYIDFDTKNKTFDTVVPMAYQIMSLLMNYERTIRDFGKCRSHAKTQFGFGLISNCVGSDFLGPCKDSLKPVPCGDYTCRSSFIECLQALVKAE